MSAPPSLKDALRQGTQAGALAFLLLLAVTLPERIRPFAPGELDLLLAARSAADGVLLPLWAGAVHPEATGSWMAALALALPLKLGVPDVLALRSFGALHLALAVGATVGLAARIGGQRVGWLAGALLLAAPGFAGAQTRYMGTTVEVAAAEAALLWGLMGLAGGKRGAGLWGIGLGLAVAFSPHAVLLVPLALWLLRRRIGALVAAAIGAAIAWVPFAILHDPRGPDRPTFAVLARDPTELGRMIDPGDLWTLIEHAPFALHPADGGLRLLFVPVLAMGLLAAVGLAVHSRGTRTAAIPIWALLTATPLLLADDLMGYPAGYRYFVNGMPPLAIAAALALPRDRRGAIAAGTLLLLGLVSLPAHRAAELDRPAAAFYAGQHRISLPPRRPLHTHFSWLWPTLLPEERAPFAQGYGLHLAREHGPMRPLFETLATYSGEDPRDRELAVAGTRPSTWVGAVTLLPRGSAQRGFLAGLGLGIGEDGRVDALEVELLRAAPDRDAVWRGIYAAVAERAHWGQAQRLVIEGDVAGMEPSTPVIVEGLAECLDGAAVRPADLLPVGAPEHWVDAVSRGELPLPRRAFGLRHPFKYADVGLGGGAARKRAR